MDENLPKAFSKALHEIRIRQGLSQMKLAEKADMHLNALGALERQFRSPNLQTVHSLAKALGMSMSDLIVEVETNLKAFEKKSKKRGHQSAE